MVLRKGLNILLKNDIIDTRCIRKTNELLHILEIPRNDDEAKKAISDFFEKYQNCDLPPSKMTEDKHEQLLFFKMRYMILFHKYYTDGKYKNAAREIYHFSRYSLTLFEPAARGMLLEAWRQVNKNDISQRIYD